MTGLAFVPAVMIQICGRHMIALGGERQLVLGSHQETPLAPGQNPQTTPPPGMQQRSLAGQTRSLELFSIHFQPDGERRLVGFICLETDTQKNKTEPNTANEVFFLLLKKIKDTCKSHIKIMFLMLLVGGVGTAGEMAP